MKSNFLIALFMLFTITIFSQEWMTDFEKAKSSANQFSFGASYTDIFTKFHIWKLGLKSIDLKYTKYDRDNTLSASIITAGFKFVMD